MSNRIRRLFPALAAAAMLALPASAMAALVAAYHFSGNANDSSGNGNHGTISGGVTPTADIAGNPAGAYLFDGGASSFISIPVDINAAAKPQLTMTAWVRPDAISNPARNTVISHDDGGYDREITIDDRSGQTGYSAFTGSGVLGGLPAPLGAWAFVAVVYDASANTVSFYKNGTKVSGAASPGPGFNTTHIGHNPGYTESFIGAIDEVRIYDSALSDGEIAALYAEFVQAGEPRAVPALDPAGLGLLATLAALLAAAALRRQRTS